MSFFDLNYSDRIVELLPPDKRTPIEVSWWRAVVKQLDWVRRNIFVDYKTGSVYPDWGVGSYNKGDRVIYGQSVYESLVSSNTAVPTDSTKWRIYQLYFIGTDERILYNGQNLVLNYALNKRFETNFRQPPLVSDIYFTINTPLPLPFSVGSIEGNSSTVFNTGSSESVINYYNFTTFYNFVINIPVAVWTALSTDVNARNKIISNFVNQYLPVGINYQIQTY